MPVCHNQLYHRPAARVKAGYFSTGIEGRKPRTHGSKLACDYIEERFKAYGLIPWNNEKGFGLSFGYGENIVGVLPGSDTNLAREFVIVSAHYDHLGKKGGLLYPGAADNASGVATLLETAKELSLFEDRPKRSIAFVAFDSEEQMLFGSFAFTCRKDVASSSIAAVVNVDMLGRDFMDVSPHTLFIAGAEHYPGICDSVCGFGTEAAFECCRWGRIWSVQGETTRPLRTGPYPACFSLVDPKSTLSLSGQNSNPSVL